MPYIPKYKKRPVRKNAKKSAPRRRLGQGKVKTMIKQEIARAIENKSFQYVGNPGLDVLPSNSPGFESQIIACTPAAGYLAIQQGVSQGGRIGNRIKIKNLTVGGVLFPLPYNATSNPTPCPLQVKVWFFYDKEEPNAIPVPQSAGDFLQFGSSAIPLQNQLFDHSMPVNTDRYRVLTTRTFKLGYASYAGTGAQPQSGNFASNDFKMNIPFKVNLTKYAVKNVVYRDNSANPTTRAIYMMMQPVYANGVAMGANTIPARYSFMLNVDYEDA